MLLLSPIAAGAIPDDLPRAVIRTREPDGSSLQLTVRRLKRLDDRTAVASLGGAQVVRLPPRRDPRTLVDAREPMFLLAPSAGADNPVHTFPIVDISGDGCAIEAGHPPPRGSLLPRVEIIRDRDVVRRCDAVVDEVIPWCTADGRNRFRCRLSLVEERGTPSDDPYALVSDPRDVTRLLRLAAMTGTVDTTVQLAGGTRLGGCRIEMGRDEMSVTTPQSVDLPSQVQLGFELFTVAYELRVRRLCTGRGRTFRLALPLFLRRRRNRQEPRVEVPLERDLWLEAVNPLTEELERRRVLDLSTGGLCFEADPSTDVLWSGLRMGPADLVGPGDGDCVRLGQIDVRSVQRQRGRTLAHCALVGRSEELHASLSQIITSLKHPELALHRGEGFRRMLDLYRRSGLLYDYMSRNLEPLAPVAGSNWRRLHQQGHDLVRTLVHEDAEGRLDATVGAVRVWEQGWVVQHFGASTSADPSRWSGELQRAIVDHVMLHPNGRFLFFFVNANNRSMNAFYERFFEATGTSEAIEHGMVDFWALPPGGAAPGGAAECVVRGVRRSDEPILARAAERALGTRTAAALSLVPGAIGLPRTRAAFRAIGLERGRRARIVSQGGEPRLALLSESLSPGVNLTWMLSAHWLLPVHDNSHDDGAALRAALETVEAEDAPSPHGERFLFTPAGAWSEQLDARGWQLRVTARTYVMNRAGLHRYFHYVADRYGAVDARNARRQRPRIEERAG